MTTYQIGALTLAAACWLVLLVGWLVSRYRHRDLVYVGLPPGLVPAPGQRVRERRVSPGPEYRGEIPVAFTPPRDLRPGLVGTIVDGSVDARDVTATIVDLAVRGWLRIRALDRHGEQVRDTGGRPQGRDWELVKSQTRPEDRLSPMESDLLRATFEHGPVARMSDFARRADDRYRRAQVALYEQALANGWYSRHPRARGSGSLGCGLVALGLGLGLLLALSRPSVWSVVAGLMAAAAFWVLPLVVRGRTPRTALGSAVRVQALGFKKYLETAEAHQLRYEEAVGTFSRYLPYAIVFGVADHWARVFAQLAREARRDGVDLLGDVTWFDAWVVAEVAGDLAQAALVGVDLADLGDLGSGFADLASEVGDFVSGADLPDLPDLGGCDGCDGCDLDF